MTETDEPVHIVPETPDEIAAAVLNGAVSRYSDMLETLEDNLATLTQQCLETAARIRETAERMDACSAAAKRLAPRVYGGAA